MSGLTPFPGSERPFGESALPTQKGRYPDRVHT